jgi:hypothetical protein
VSSSGAPCSEPLTSLGIGEDGLSAIATMLAGGSTTEL